MVGLQFDVHQVFQLEWIHLAADHHAQIVLDEFNGVVVLHYFFVLAEHGAFTRVFDFAFQTQHAIFAGDVEQVVHQPEQVQIVGLAILGALHQAANTTPCFFGAADAIGDDKATQRRATDDHHFGRLPQSHDIAAMHSKSAQH